MKVMNRKMQYIFTVLLLLGLISCTPKINLRQLAKLRVGMSSDEPPRVMGVHPIKVYDWSLAETGDRIIVQSYVLKVAGDSGSTYFLAFKNGSLIFWGYPHEFARSSDPFIRKIGKEALKHQRKSSSNADLYNDRGIFT